VGAAALSSRRDLQLAEGPWPGDPVDLESVGRLKTAHRARRQRSVATVDRAGRVPVTAKPPLKYADAAGPGPGVPGTREEQRRWGAQRRKRDRARDAVHAQPVTDLKPLNGALGQRAVTPVDWSRRVSGALQATLERLDRARVRAASVAAPEGQRDEFGWTRRRARRLDARCRGGKGPARLQGEDENARGQEYDCVFRGRVCTGQEPPLEA
jgi:hypothetical protein